MQKKIIILSILLTEATPYWLDCGRMFYYRNGTFRHTHRHLDLHTQPCSFIHTDIFMHTHRHFHSYTQTSAFVYTNIFNHTHRHFHSYTQTFSFIHTAIFMYTHILHHRSALALPRSSFLWGGYDY